MTYDHAPEANSESISQRVATAVADAGGLGVLVDSFKVRDQRVVLQAITLGALLTRFPTIAKILWREGLVRALVGFLSEHPTSYIKTIQNALSILGNLARVGNDETLEEMDSLGGLNIALHYLDNDDVGIREQASGIIRSYTKNSRYCQEILNCDGLPLLASHLTREDMMIDSPVFPLPLYYNALVSLVHVVAACSESQRLIPVLKNSILSSCTSLIQGGKNLSVIRQVLRLLHALVEKEDPSIQALVWKGMGLDSPSSESLLLKIIGMLQLASAQTSQAALFLLANLSGAILPLVPEDVTTPFDAVPCVIAGDVDNALRVKVRF